MAGLKLSHIYKVYPNGAKAVNDFNMDIEDKEFIVFVGPSGCGKSTTLRMIAGLEDITAGELKIGGSVINNVEPKDRDIAMVFQNYALYPHMTVYKNMAFGLKLRKTPKEEIDRKVKEAAEILGITEYLDRKPREMSGGQRQRVALGRAIVREPKVFLLDEPLSNLDAKLRTAMRSEISKLHAKLKTTFIYVTHDQVEAMTMGTRIVVMNDGFVQQIDSPRNLYRYPENKFVAGFIGTPQMNFLDCRIKLCGNKAEVALDGTDAKFSVPSEIFNKAERKYLDGVQELILGLRAEHISANAEKYAYRAKCRVTNVEELGVESLLYADFDLNLRDGAGESPTRIILKADAGADYEYGSVIEVSLDLSNMIVFDKVTEKSIMHRIPEAVVVDGEVKAGVLKMLGWKTVLPPAIRLEDGKYSVTVPVSAVALNGDIKAEIFKEEQINGKRLSHLRVADRVLFTLDDGARPENVKGVSIDLKQLTFTDGERGVDALNCVNSLECSFVKFKDEHGRGYGLDIAGSVLSCTQDTADTVLGVCGRDIYKRKLEMKISVYDVKISVDGIPAEVVRVLDYGEETFAVLDLGGQTVTVAVEKGFSGTNEKIGFDLNKTELYEKERDIRLI